MAKLYCDAPGSSFCFSASTFLKGQAFTNECPYRITDSQGNTYDTQWALIAKTSEGIQVEFSADIDRPLSGPQVFTLTDGQTFKTRTDAIAEFLPVINQLSVRFHLQDHTTFDVPIKFQRSSVHRRGPARTTFVMHATHIYGGIHAFADFKAHATSLGLTLNFHNALIPPKGKFYFSAIELLLPENYEFSESIPYGTKQGSFLVPHGTHMIPQRRQLSRRLQIHKTGVNPVKDTWGQGFGNYFTGGYLPASYEVGHLTNAAQKLTSEYGAVLNKFSNALSEFSGQPQPDRLWQSQNSTYGGMTGGTDIESIPDPELADSKLTIGLEMLMMRSNRYRNRQTGPIIESSGEHAVCEDYQNADSSLPWLMFSNGFQTQGGKPQEGPFTFSKALPNAGSCTYESALLAWMPIDHQHLRRVTKQDQQLVWHMNDPLARLYCLQDAELQRMCYWDQKGGRLNINFTSTSSGQDLGRELAWMIDCVAFAVCLGGQSSEHFSGLQRWLANSVAILAKAALPNGLVNVKRSGKIFTDSPFSSQYWGFQMFETCFLAHALQSAQKALGSRIAFKTLTNLIRGIWEYAWDHSKPGPQYKTPTHKKDVNGSFVLLQSCPALDAKLETFNLGALPGLAWNIKQVDPTSGLQPEAMFCAHHSSPALPQALTKALATPSTYAHTANSIAIAQRVVLGITE